MMIKQGLVLSILICNIGYALPLSIVPKQGTEFPSSIPDGMTVTAYYTVTNLTSHPQENLYVKYLPPNVTQVPGIGTYADTCETTFNLAAFGHTGDSCTLQLTVSGHVDAKDPKSHHHLFICYPDKITCVGTLSPLNVS